MPQKLIFCRALSIDRKQPGAPPCPAEAAPEGCTLLRNHLTRVYRNIFPPAISSFYKNQAPYCTLLTFCEHVAGEILWWFYLFLTLNGSAKVAIPLLSGYLCAVFSFGETNCHFLNRHLCHRRCIRRQSTSAPPVLPPQNKKRPPCGGLFHLSGEMLSGWRSRKQTNRLLSKARRPEGRWGFELFGGIFLSRRSS